ncbi:Superoxide dismutase [Cu-Zn] precursor [Candidatus Ornithobacterium hominis]|uniref:superoxide dismutase family protein n=1 Tax=Candidatus Ornithobacterium hominis TaxID=2497989 RepID=UPI000E5ACD48|nr:superoxide dismutase family protein [Candidatus Ornithobacterium hominis]SZD72610.1 Superoxide dismutase [Cu-Zn] precursor [Candidatus Ornithobacterium hominis]
MKKLVLGISLASMIFAVQSCEKKNETQNTDSEIVAPSEDSEMGVVSEVIVPLSSKSGSSVAGSATFTQSGNEVTLKVDVTGLKGSEHAIHIHENGDCSADDGSSAGGHWNPTGDDHGKWGEGDFHYGDIGNLVADAEGKSTLVFTTDKWTLEENAENGLRGKSVIIHAKADDFTSQPSGAAGDRIACGVIK